MKNEPPITKESLAKTYSKKNIAKAIRAIRIGKLLRKEYEKTN